MTPRRPSGRTRRKDPGFAIGDVVDYHSVIGQEVTAPGMTIIDGPFEMCGTRCWTLNGKRGVVAEAALSRPEPCKACAVRTGAGLEGQCPACANERARSTP